jgi:teichuronic acid biosynthesis glycosyltransferase TuaC
LATDVANLKVLVLSYLFPNSAQPGYGVFVLHRIAAVSRRCLARVVAPVPWYPFIRWLRPSVWGGRIPRRETQGGLDVDHPRFAIVPRYFKWFDALSFLFAAWRSVRRLGREGFAFDLVDVHWTYPDVVAGFVLARRRGCPFIVTVRGHEALYAEERSIRRQLVAACLRRADAVVALSGELRDAVIALGVKPERVHVILNGVDGSRFTRMDRDACRAALGLAADRRIVLAVGRLTEGKGHQHIIRALAAPGGPATAELFIVGGVNPEARFDQDLRALVKEHAIESRVHFLDEQSQERLALWYGASDVFCLASHREGCPNVVLEALACGTPVVANDVGAVSQFVGHDDGVLVRPGDAAALTHALAEALSRRWDRGAIAARMSERSWDSVARQVVELYEAVLK